MDDESRRGSAFRYDYYILSVAFSAFVFSTLMLLVGWQEGQKNFEWWGAGVVVCMERGADLHMAQLVPLPLTVSCFSIIQIGFTFLVPAHPDSPGIVHSVSSYLTDISPITLSSPEGLMEIIRTGLYGLEALLVAWPAVLKH